MGTSTGYSLPKTGNWPDAKREVTAWGGSGVSTPKQLGKVTGEYVQAHGGARAAAQQSPVANLTMLSSQVTSLSEPRFS